MLSNEVVDFPYSPRYPPPDLSNPFASLSDLRSVHQFSLFSNDSTEDWDPYKAYDAERFRRNLTSHQPPSTTHAQLKSGFLRPRSRTISGLGSTPTSSSSARKYQIIHRRLLTMPPPLASSNTEDSSGCAVLPPVRVSLIGSRSFTLSLSRFGNVSDRDHQSFSSEHDSKLSEKDLDVRSEATANYPLSNSDLRDFSSFEKPADNPVQLDFINFSDPVCISPPAPPKAIRQSTPQLLERSHRFSTPHLPQNSAIHLCGGSMSIRDRTVSVNTSLSPAPQLQGPWLDRRLPRPPADHLHHSRRISNWSPPSDWGFNGSQSSTDSKDPPLFTEPLVASKRPHSTFHFEPDMRSCKGQVIRPLGRKSLHPRTAPIGDSPPRKINQSPLEALENEQLNFIRFDRTALPTRADLEAASKLEVISEKGVRVPFGTLFYEKKTVVIFIRCFWCPFCQDYMYSLNTTANLDMLSSHDVNLVVVGNGSHAMIKGYRKIFKFPFKIYTDPSLDVYRALGMTLRTTSMGPKCESGDYVKHGIFTGMGMVLKNALTNCLPVLKDGGNLRQLGGEFILGPGFTSSYAHRMHTTRSHAPVMTVLEAAGLPVRAKVHAHRKLSSCASEADEESWMAKRAKNMASLRKRKEERRSGLLSPKPL